MNPSKILPAVMWMTGALLSFCALAVSVRVLASVLSIFEILTIRAAVGLAVVVAIALARPKLMSTLAPRRLGLHALRNVVHYAAQYAWATALTLLPFATVFALEFTMPAWTAVLAVMFLGERLSPSRIGVIVLGILGVVVIVRPGLAPFQPAALLVLAAAVGYAVTMVTTKELTRSEANLAILFWMGVIQLPLTLIASDPLFVMRLSPGMYLPALAVGLAGLASHYCLSNAFRAADAIVVVPLDFVRLPLIALIGWWMYGEAVDVLVFVGAGLIIAGILWNLRVESRPALVPPPTMGPV